MHSPDLWSTCRGCSHSHQDGPAGDSSLAQRRAKINDRGQREYGVGMRSEHEGAQGGGHGGARVPVGGTGRKAIEALVGGAPQISRSSSKISGSSSTGGVHGKSSIFFAPRRAAAAGATAVDAAGAGSSRDASLAGSSLLAGLPGFSSAAISTREGPGSEDSAQSSGGRPVIVDSPRPPTLSQSRDQGIENAEETAGARGARQASGDGAARCGVGRGRPLPSIPRKVKSDQSL